MGNIVNLADRRAARPDSAEFGLVLKFDTDEPEFTRGFEAGMLWQALTEEPASREGTYHRLNVRMLERIAAAKGFTVEVKNTTDVQWVTAVFTKVGPPRTR